MTCPKRDVAGTWFCGRPALHLGAHLSADALQQTLLARAKLEEKLLVVKGEEFGAVRRKLARIKRVLG